MKTIRHTMSVLLTAMMLMIPTCAYLFMNGEIPNSLETALVLLGIQTLWIMMMVNRQHL